MLREKEHILSVRCRMRGEATGETAENVEEIEWRNECHVWAHFAWSECSLHRYSLRRTGGFLVTGLRG